MSGHATPAPEGYVRVAWATYPSLHGAGRLSMVHLRDDGSKYTRCGMSTRGAGPFACVSERGFAEHEADAGLCSRCWKGFL